MMSSSVGKLASNGVVGGKTARACDSCVKKRARWYCAADDAFLCQACDNSVHSANSLARRHERVRLKTASSSSLNPSSTTDEQLALTRPTWHRGVTRKARTPRSGKMKHVTRPKLRKDHSRDHHHLQFDPLVPEICGDETSHEENEEQLLYRVPIFDPSVAGLCTTNSANSNGVIESKAVSPSVNNCGGTESTNLQQFLPTEMDLAEFAADVESLLGNGLENESFGIEGLGFVDCKEKEQGRVKVKEEEDEEEGKNLNSTCCSAETSTEIDMMRPEPLELNFEDYEESPVASCGEEDDRKVALVEAVSETKTDEGEEKKSKKKKKVLLRLDYEAVITAWASQGSPWTTGDRPDFDPDACWPDCLGTYATQQHRNYMDLSGVGANPAILADGGREARVSRYREKRRTRLFSKKIRYEVRKLNAEKRPRMKGRFVKRASFAGPNNYSMLSSK